MQFNVDDLVQIPRGNNTWQIAKISDVSDIKTYKVYWFSGNKIKCKRVLSFESFWIKLILLF
jgi:hypothetical protein